MATLRRTFLFLLLFGATAWGEGVTPRGIEIGDLLPWGVDVATGVEGGGHRKDPGKIAAFIEAVRRAEAGS